MIARVMNKVQNISTYFCHSEGGADLKEIRLLEDLKQEEQNRISSNETIKLNKMGKSYTIMCGNI